MVPWAFAIWVLLLFCGALVIIRCFRSFTLEAEKENAQFDEKGNFIGQIDSKMGDQIADIASAEFEPATAVQMIYSVLIQDPTWATYLKKEREQVRENYVADALKEAGDGAVALHLVDDYDYDGNYMFYVLVGLRGYETWYLVMMSEIFKDVSPETE